MAFFSGLILPVQAALNTRLAKAVESPVYSSLISFMIGSLTLSVFIATTGQSLNTMNVKSAPSHIWAGGVLGACYVTIIIYAFPRIGPAFTFGLIVAGQMISSLLLDHFNILVAAQHSINIWRIIGIVMIIAGVVMVRKF